MKSRLLLMFGVLVVVAAACSSGASKPDQTQVDAESPDTTLQATGEQSQEVPEDTSSAEVPPADDVETNPPSESVSGGGSATLTLENGESFTFSILCALDPQESGGQEILFTVVSYDEPYNLDVTQFGADSFNGAANISLYDAATFETVWESNTFFGGEVELELSGNTVTGRGMFVAGEDATGPDVSGEFEANC